MFKKVALVVTLAMALGANVTEAGQLDSSNFTVQATISGTCTAVTPQALFDFGSLVGTAANTDSTMTVNVTCSNSLPYLVGISYGNAGNFNRVMKNGANSLSYQLYVDSAHNTVLADPAAGLPAQMIPGTGNGSSQALTIYGRVPVQASPVPGVYTDTLVASVTW